MHERKIYNMTRPEILAPGGSKESIYSAINAGCDAIYAGGKKFGARAFADNQDHDNLIDILKDIHLAGKKLYLTVNTILTENEISQLYDYLCPLYDNGLDAVIVQDMGVLKFVHEHFPGLPIHASTQMSITRAAAANLLMNYGVTRVVPARELSLNEIKTMRAGTDAELEVFVHGALCSSYSGQCLMSSLIGGRSGNRGACAQPCRKQYCLNGSRPGYYLSLRDLCTLELIPELIKCGIDSFKIEGRMKKPEYTALAASMYRKYVDRYFQIGDEAYAEMIKASSEFADDMKALKDVYNRGGFSKSYLVNNMNNSNMLSGNRPNHEGINIGIVDSIKKGKVFVRYSDKISSGDLIEIRNAYGEKVHDFTIGQDYLTGDVQSINPGYNYNNISKGMKVYRVRNKRLIDNILTKYPVKMKQIMIEGRFKAKIGQAAELSVWLSGSDISHTVYGDIVTGADKHPADKEYIKSKVMVSGDSGFAWKSLDIDIDEGIYLSPAKLKDIRRQTLMEYADIYQGIYCQNVYQGIPSFEEAKTYSWSDVAGMGNSNAGNVIAECYNEEQIAEVLRYDIYDTLYIRAQGMDVRKAAAGIDKSFYIILPRIIRDDSQYKDYEKLMCNIKNESEYFKGIIVCTLEQLAMYRDVCSKHNIELGMYDNMYVRNASAAAWFFENGADSVMSAVEMTDREITDMSDCFTKGMGPSVLLYGKPAAMITAWTPGKQGILKDSYNNEYRVIGYDDYNEIINYEAVDRIDSLQSCNIPLRVIFTDESADEIVRVTKRIRKRLEE